MHPLEGIMMMIAPVHLPDIQVLVFPSDLLHAYFRMVGYVIHQDGVNHRMRGQFQVQVDQHTLVDSRQKHLGLLCL